MQTIPWRQKAGQWFCLGLGMRIGQGHSERGITKGHEEMFFSDGFFF